MKLATQSGKSPVESYRPISKDTNEIPRELVPLIGRPPHQTSISERDPQIHQYRRRLEKVTYDESLVEGSPRGRFEVQHHQTQ